jgi:predicted extracellular nuclease
VVLADPARVRFLDRGAAGSTDSISVTADGRLSASQGRIAARHPAFVAEPETGDEGGRKPLAVELEVDGRRLVVVNLHLRSKWGDDPEYGRFQPPRRPSETQRREQALAVNDFVRQLLASDPELAVVVLGDLNEHPGRPPVRALEGRELVNLVDALPPEERYTYVYYGASQVLDHILVSPVLLGGAEVDVVHVNAEWPDAWRSSDHDPVVARFVWP